MSGAGTEGLPVVVVVGRPNVGKSSLFNRLVGRRRAIVDDAPGVTRDRVVAPAVRDGHAFVCIDTGGFDAQPQGETELLDAIRAQALEAVADADCIVLVVDGRAGLLPADQELARLLLKSGRPIVLAVNKIDGEAHGDLVPEFHRLGIDPLVPTSAAHRLGTGDLADAIVAALPATTGEAARPGGTRLALLGRPNVGKSSLLNRLLGAERAVVSAVAGTTRDTIDSAIMLGERPYVLIDTAGIRRRGRVRDPLERHGAVRALGMLARTDLVLMVLDARDGVTEQDARLIGRALELGRGIVLVVNKWDLLPAGERLAAWRHRVRGQHPAFAELPAVGVSALEGTGIGELVATVQQVEDAYGRRKSTAEVNRVLADALAAHPPPSPGGRPIRILYATQVASGPPTFAVFASAPSKLPVAYTRYLENTFRDRFDLAGVPIRIRLRPRRELPADVSAPRSRGSAGRGRRSGRPMPRAPRARRR